MTNISRTTLRELKKRYLNILKKCFLANLMAFGMVTLATPAMAGEDRLVNSGEKTYTQDVTFEGKSATATGSSPFGGAIFNIGFITFGGFATFEGNSVTATGTHPSGGAISNYYNASITFDALATFEGNSAIATGGSTNGGAISNYKSIAFGGLATFEGNSATATDGHSYGGAIHNSGASAVLTFNDGVQFKNNTTTATAMEKADGTLAGGYSYGGAINNSGTITFDALATFEGNSAIATGGPSQGGAINNGGANAVVTFNDEAQFKNSTATATAMEKADGTLAGGYSYGGAIANGSTITFGGLVTFEGNTSSATGSLSYGGAIYNGGTITFDALATFDGNSATAIDGHSYGGAIHNSGTITFDALATFDGNSAIATGGNSFGGAINNGTNVVLTFNDKAQFKNNTATATAMEKADGTLAGGYSYGGAINNNGVNAVLTFNDEAQFKNNTATATAMEKADGTLAGGYSYGGAIMNYASITFDALATFDGNSAIATGGSANGGAINNHFGTITFDALATFDGNSAIATGGNSFGGAINNGGERAVLTFNNEAQFKNNTATTTAMEKADGTLADGDSYGGAIFNHNNAIINFNNSFTFTGNKTISKGVETSNDIHNSGTINFKHGLDENNNPLIGSLDGGILNYGTINKTGAGTLILGDGMKNSGGGTFTQSAGLTIAHTEHFLTGTNTITGGELRVHGASLANLKASVSNGAMLTYLTTRTERQNVALGTNVNVIGANVTFGAYEGVEQAQYTLGSDIASDARALKVIIQDSNIKITGDTYAGSYEIGSSNVIEMRDESIEEQSVTFADLDGSGATLSIDISLLKDSEGKTQLTADRLNLTSDGEGYKFAGVSFNTPMDGQALLDEILSGLMVGQDGTITPSIKHTVQVLGGNASFMGRKEATLSTASPYVYEVATAGQDLTVSADVLKGSALEYLNDTDTDVTLQIAEKGDIDYTVTEDLGEMGCGKKQILGSTNDATESVIDASGKDLFTLGKADTELEMKNLTITGAGTAIDNQSGKAHLENVVIKDTVGDTALANGAEMTLKDVSVDKGVVNSGKLTMSGNNALTTLTNNGETMVEGGKLSVTTLGGNGTLTMNGAELDSTNIATNNTIVSNGMTVSDRLSTLGVKSLEVKDGTTLDLNLAMTTADKIKNEGDMIANKDISVGALEGAGTLTVNNATLNVADKFATSNKIVSNGMKIGDNVTSEIHFADLEIKDNTTLDIKTLQATANTVTVGENATLGITLKNLDEYGTMKADEIIAKEDSKVHLTLGDNFAGGVFDVFKGTKGSGDLELVHNNVYNVVEVSEGKYSFMAKDTEALQESLGTTDNETVIANALTQGTTSHAVFSRMQSEMLVALQSQNKETVAKAKKALNALGARSTSVYQSQATAQFTQMHTVITQMLMNSTAPIFGHAGGEEPARATVYVKGLYDRVNSLAGDGFRMRSKGAVLGVQSAITEDLTVGIGYAGINSVAKEPLRRTEVDTNTGFISAQYQPNNWWVNGVLTYSRSQYDEEKNILSTQGIAKYDVDSLGAQITTGYNIKRGNWIVTPEVGVRYLNARQEGYVDSLGTTVEKTTSDFVTTMAGFKVGVDLGWMRPLAGVMVGYDVVTDDISAVNTLANKETYIIKGEALDRLSTTVVAGFAADIGDNATLKLEYSGNYRKEYLDHSGMLRLEWRF